jgi:hypothetical protein
VRPLGSSSIFRAEARRVASAPIAASVSFESGGAPVSVSGRSPVRAAANATHLYIAPVSMRTYPSRSATRLATVLLPAPAGPSIATMRRARFTMTIVV